MRNHDGRLERRELRAWRTLLDAQRELKRLDTDWSGRIDPRGGRRLGVFRARMSMLDLDRNGRVQPDELTQAMLDAYRRGDRAFVARFGQRNGGSVYVSSDRRFGYDRYRDERRNRRIR